MNKRLLWLILFFVFLGVVTTIIDTKKNAVKPEQTKQEYIKFRANLEDSDNCQNDYSAMIEYIQNKNYNKALESAKLANKSCEEPAQRLNAITGTVEVPGKLSDADKNRFVEAQDMFLQAYQTRWMNANLAVFPLASANASGANAKEINKISLENQKFQSEIKAAKELDLKNCNELGIK